MALVCFGHSLLGHHKNCQIFLLQTPDGSETQHTTHPRDEGHVGHGGLHLCPPVFGKLKWEIVSLRSA